MNKHPWFAVLCLGLAVASVSAQTTMIEGFEYASDDDLRVVWTGSGGAPVSVSDVVAPRATGTKSMRIDFSFGSSAWATETIRGTDLPAMLVIGSSQYLVFRLKGDPAFQAADFKNLYLYAYDDQGNFGRWVAGEPVSGDWQIVNCLASNIGKPWDSPGLPDLSRIIRFAFFQYGSEAAIAPYTATIYIDELHVRDTPLVEFPPPAAPRVLIDDFEGYADDAALRAAYTYQNSPAATVTTASVSTPAPQGSKALKLGIDFAAGQWPWGSVRSAVMAPFSFPSNAVATVRLKGDPTFATIADGGTQFWLSFYDQGGNRMNFNTLPAPVISSDWVTLEAPLSAFWSDTLVDTGNLVQWRILVEGWTGTGESPARSGAFYVDDIRIAVPVPQISIERAGPVTRITYTGQLQSASAVTGDYKEVQGATSPYEIPAGAGIQFYRSKN